MPQRTITIATGASRTFTFRLPKHVPTAWIVVNVPTHEQHYTSGLYHVAVCCEAAAEFSLGCFTHEPLSLASAAAAHRAAAGPRRDWLLKAARPHRFVAPLVARHAARVGPLAWPGKHSHGQGRATPPQSTRLGGWRPPSSGFTAAPCLG
tara:strand:+ start:260 stop:709 length:450 start_codon:yes stop_codon:yes gene_type:complete